MTPAACPDLVSLLRMRAGAGAAAYAFLGDGESETARLSHADLDRAAAVLAARLRGLGLGSSHVLLAYPPGLEFIVGFFGCLYAGCVPVPVALPHPRKPDERLPAIAADCEAKAVLSTEAGCRVLAAAAGAAPGPRPIATGLDTEGPAIAAPWQPQPEEVAFLQYTSGSTRAPRGVCVTHANVVANLAAIHAAERNGPHSRGVSWLPAHHDMGLVEGLLQPLYGGFTTALLPHAAFLQKPVRWLQAISRLRATVSGGPNFAFDACVRRVKEADLAALDLGCWQVAYCGAEPVRAETLAAFADRFAQCGFAASALRPVYGLAEATLLVTASRAGAPAPTSIEVDRACLEQAREPVAVPAKFPAGARSKFLVSCGRPDAGVQVRIVDAERCVSLPESRVGEIWVAGPSVARGYHGAQSRSEAVFVDCTLDGAHARWLRTGDLGCMLGGELYVTGRCKDVVIVRGRKIHPQDVEHGVQRLDPHRIAAAACFAREDEAGEGVVLLVELGPRVRPEDAGGTAWTRLADDVRAQVFHEHEIALSGLAFVPAGALARTTSGKLMRYRCRDDYALGRMPVIARFDHAASRAAAPAPAV